MLIAIYWLICAAIVLAVLLECTRRTDYQPPCDSASVRRYMQRNRT